MNQFLHNLIVRHQAAGANLVANHIIQPRPKYRFESEPVTSSLGQFDSGIAETITSVSEQSLMNPQTSEVHQAETDKKNSVVGIGLTDENKLTGVEPSLFEETRLMKKRPNFTAQNESVQHPDYYVESSKSEQQFDKIHEQKNNQILSISDELQPRVQTILHRLNSQQAQHFDQTSATELQQDNSVLHNELPGSEELSVMSEQTLDFDQKGKVKENLANRSEQWSNRHEKSHQSGLLQTPDWLTQIQSELSQRQREISAHKESETVVNVTIGRVEVKAVQTDSAQKPKSSNKPSGIMSLDDYLTKRDKGRA